MSELKEQLRRSILIHDLGVAILTGEEAVEAFDNDRRAARMRASTDLAIARLNELLRWLKREHEGLPDVSFPK